MGSCARANDSCGSADKNGSSEAAAVRMHVTYLRRQRVPASGGYICNTCRTRQIFREGDLFGPCRVCGRHANAWTRDEDQKRCHPEP